MSGTKALMVVLAVAGLCVAATFAGPTQRAGELEEIKAILLNSQRVQFMMAHGNLFKHSIGDICDLGPSFPEKCGKIHALQMTKSMIHAIEENMTANQRVIDGYKQRGKDKTFGSAVGNEKDIESLQNSNEESRKSIEKYRTTEAALEKELGIKRD